MSSNQGQLPPKEQLLSEAKREYTEHNSNPTHIVIEGDHGGQVYMTVPVKLIKASEEEIRKLAKWVDSICWDCNEGEGVMILNHSTEVKRRIYREKYANLANARITEDRFVRCIGGGMGGGLLKDDEPWYHEELIELGLIDRIEQALFGKE